MDKPVLTFGSLFSGIGGLDLGLERAGMQCAWQVEIDDYATKVLAKHWPNTPRFRDVRECGKHNLAHVDVIAGGFPCQDISDAGKQTGIDGERSGLWKEFHRIICEIRPRYVIVENVAALLHRGMDRVLGDLAACGYDAEWQILSAESVGAPHLRERIFIVAYPACGGVESERVPGQGRHTLANSYGSSQEMANTQGVGRNPWGAKSAGQRGEIGSSCASIQVPNTNSDRLRDRALQHQLGAEREAAAIIGNDGPQGVTANPDFQSLEVGACFGRDAHQKLTSFERSCGTGTGQWAVEPAICRVVDGVPHRVDRLRGLGNAVVPQVAEFVGRCIVAAEAERRVVA